MDNLIRKSLLLVKSCISQSLRNKLKQNEVLLKFYKNFVYRRNYRAQHYTKWLKKAESLWFLESNYFHNTGDLTISVILPTYNSNISFLKEAINSVLAQNYQNWELCIADDCSTEPSVKETILRYCQLDTRIKSVFRDENGHISQASNSSLEIATGDWCVLLDHDDKLHANALNEIASAITLNQSVNFIYSDEDKIDINGCRTEPHFKGAWNRRLFYSQNYICHVAAFKTDLLKRIGGFRVGLEGSQDYDLMLRYFKEIDFKGIIHIPKILYHWRKMEGSTALSIEFKSYAHQAGITALKDHFLSLGDSVSVDSGLSPTTYRVQNILSGNTPKISLVIPTRNALQVTERAVTSILDKTEYSNFEVIIVDNQSDDEEALEYFERVQKYPNVRVLKYDKPFNYSAINNFAVNNAEGEIIGLINNDVELITGSWLEQIVSLMQMDDVGCVGAKLYYPNEKVQHAGVIVGIGGVAGHGQKFSGKDDGGYFERLKLIQNVSAVTGACLFVDKKIYNAVGGLDEELAVAFNDVDFCLKVSKLGFENIWTPFVELYHYESYSRGQDISKSKQKRFQSEVEFMKAKWKKNLLTDQYYNPNLSHVLEDFSLSDFNVERDKDFAAR